MIFVAVWIIDFNCDVSWSSNALINSTSLTPVTSNLTTKHSSNSKIMERVLRFIYWSCLEYMKQSLMWHITFMLHENFSLCCHNRFLSLFLGTFYLYHQLLLHSMLQSTGFNNIKHVLLPQNADDFPHFFHWICLGIPCWNLFTSNTTNTGYDVDWILKPVLSCIKIEFTNQFWSKMIVE